MEVDRLDDGALDVCDELVELLVEESEADELDKESEVVVGSEEKNWQAALAELD